MMGMVFDDSGMGGLGLSQVELSMQSLVQPGAGVAPLLSAIRAAKKSVELMIFRFDDREVELALERAVSRGVSVHALIAYSNRGGEQKLRTLEARLLSAGVM